jgi:ketosteroid isomerase-like protein
MTRVVQALILTVAALLMQSAVASDVDEITALLQDFLENSHKEAAHERFWAEDLVYSSSAGLRFGKAEIMEGFDSSSDATEDANDEPQVTYSGKEVDVRLYGDTAVVAFKLVGTPTDTASGAEVLYYFNTGTFLKRDGVWRVVAWQATKIPPQ